MSQPVKSSNPLEDNSERGTSRRDVLGVIIVGVVIAAITMWPSWESLTAMMKFEWTSNAKPSDDVGMVATLELPESERIPKGIWQEAEKAFSNEDWKLASEKYAEFLDMREDNEGSIWFRFGYALHSQGKYEEAMRAHREAAEFARYAPTARYNLACALALTGKPDAAINELESALDEGFLSRSRSIEEDEDFVSILGDPRFKKLAERARSMDEHTPIRSGTSNSTEDDSDRAP